jgi:hypothetical protein
MHARLTRRDDAAPTFDRVSNWKDGQQRKVTRDATQEGGQPICTVGTNPNTELRSFRFNQVMGLWILDDGPLTSVVDWIEQCARNPKCSVTCTRTEYQGRPAVSVVAFSEVQTRTFWFDPPATG